MGANAEMSFQAMSWAIRQKLKTHPKMLLLALANYADSQGKCWPSKSTLADDTGMGKTAVCGHLKALEELGLLRIERRVDATGYASSMIHLTLFASDTTLVREENSPCSPGEHKPIIEPVIEPIPPIVPRKRVTSVKDVKPVGWEGDFNEDFDFLWGLYPRKIGKSVAKKALEKAARKVTAADLHASLLKTLARWKKEGREEQHIPHFATWLNQERWLDDA